MLYLLINSHRINQSIADSMMVENNQNPPWGLRMLSEIFGKYQISGESLDPIFWLE